jgi:hypothetical protein
MPIPATGRTSVPAGDEVALLVVVLEVVFMTRR